MIYVVGSINADISLNLSKVPRVGETVRAQSVKTGTGGKGANQAAAIAKMGGECKMIGKVGSDALGAKMIADLNSYGVDTGCVSAADCESGTAYIWVHGGNNRIVINGGANDRLTEQDVYEGLKDAAAGDVLMTQLEIPLNVTLYALKLGRRKGMITMLNPAPSQQLNGEFYVSSEIITPNETETYALTGVNPDCETNVALAAKKFRDMGANNIIITLGKIGSAVIAGNSITLLPSVKVKAVDSTAAGDTYVGAAALQLTRRKTLNEAAEFATVASGLKVTRRGAADAIPTEREINEFAESLRRK